MRVASFFSGIGGIDLGMERAEKLVSMLSENDGRAATYSPEGGIFDLLKGIYSKYVNIDVFLKGYSGDPIRVDRIGRESETIYQPALTVMLMAQPSVLAGVMENGNFRGRGLTARFLYCVPESNVGRRKYRSEVIPDEVYRRYEDECDAVRDRLYKVFGLEEEIRFDSLESRHLDGMITYLEHGQI